jgi:hypothetical protein
MLQRIRRLLTSLLLVATGMVCLPAAPAAAFNDCDRILPATDRLDTQFNLVSASGTPPWVASQIRNALAPLHGLRTPAAVDLRIRSDMLASSIDGSDIYRPTSPDQVAGDLAQARQLLAAARDFCAP